MTIKREFWYEDFCQDISNYLKEHEKEYIQYSVDPFSPLASINIDKLAILLSKFWNEIPQ